MLVISAANIIMFIIEQKACSCFCNFLVTDIKALIVL